MRFYAVLRISSLPIPLVNLTDLCKKFGTCWHTCAKTCAKSTIFQICLYEAKLNGNNLNYIYNFHKFQLFPIVSVLLSSIWVCCSYFPMQKFLKMFWRTESVETSPMISERWWIVSRRSWEMKSPERFNWRPSMTRVMASCAWQSAS